MGLRLWYPSDEDEKSIRRERSPIPADSDTRQETGNDVQEESQSADQEEESESGSESTNGIDPERTPPWDISDNDPSWETDPHVTAEEIAEVHDVFDEYWEALQRCEADPTQILPALHNRLPANPSITLIYRVHASLYEHLRVWSRVRRNAITTYARTIALAPEEVHNVIRDNLEIRGTMSVLDEQIAHDIAALEIIIDRDMEAPSDRRQT